MSSHPDEVLELLGVRPSRVVAIRNVPLGNGNWLVETAPGLRFVLRRYHARTTQQDLAYEHAVLDYLATGNYDLAMIERQLSRTGTSAP